jgi:hypothetical protein
MNEEIEVDGYSDGEDESARKKNSRRKSRVIAAGTASVEPPSLYFDGRCHCCIHEYRKTIDKLCVTSNISPTEIARMFGVSRASVVNHGKNHLDYAEASIRRVIEAEASATQENVEDGVRGILARRVFLSSYIQRTMEALLNNELPLSGKEAMAAINMLTQYEESETVAQMAELQDQFDAFQQAMKEIVPADAWYAIVARTEEIYKTSGMMAKLKQITEGQDGA